MSIPVTSKGDILERLQRAHVRLASFGVSQMSLFGSFVTGQQTPNSDVDLLVEFLPSHHTFDSFMELSFFLEDLLGRRVELVTPESLSPHLAPHILREVERVKVAA